MRSGAYIRVKVFEPSNLADDRSQRPGKLDDHHHPNRYRLTTAVVKEVSDTTVSCWELGKTLDNVFVDGVCPNFNSKFRAWIVATNTDLTRDEFEPVETSP